MSITSKKMKIIPVGDHDEKQRVYEYFRDGIYAQHRILNTYMSQMGITYHKYNKNFKDPDYKEEVKNIFRNTNIAIHDIEQAKGLGMAGNCGMRVKRDFSTALKNGLAKGERQLPFYKRDYPLMIPSRLFSIYKKPVEYTNRYGDKDFYDEFFIKFPNKITCKVVTGSRGYKDQQLMSMLNKICNPDCVSYKTCGSDLSITEKGLIFNLCVKCEEKKDSYLKVKNRILSISFGYNQPCLAYINDLDTFKAIGKKFSDELVQKRIGIQNKRRDLSINSALNSGGSGRKNKLKPLTRYKNYEKNTVRKYNHIISKEIIDYAVTNRVETIIIKNPSASVRKAPIVLRNWSFSELFEQITYKAKTYSIKVKSIEAPHLFCSCCGNKIDESLDYNQIWIESIMLNCDNCGSTIDYYENEAKSLIKIYEEK